MEKKKKRKKKKEMIMVMIYDSMQDGNKYGRLCEGVWRCLGVFPFAGSVWRRGRGRGSSAGSDARARSTDPGPTAQRISTRVGLHTSRGYR